MTPSTVERYAERKRRTRWCHIEGCIRFTQGGKPFCSNHVESHRYVQELQVRIQNREGEESRAKRYGWRAVNIDGPIAKDIISFLRVHGERSIPRVAKDLNRDKYITKQFIEALRQAGLVKTRQNLRGIYIVKAI